jgi:DNA-binding transcriptional LysR family regulator
MINIPTDLLRTLIAVVELRSFTKAAHSLGVTQPAVSAQIKRLQQLLDADLLDKSAPGVSLTPTGELVVNYAQRLLSINDQILHAAGPRPQTKTIRIGAPAEMTDAALTRTLAEFRSGTSGLCFDLHESSPEAMFHELRQDDLDLVIAQSTTVPAFSARHHWTEDLVWLHAEGTRLNAAEPVSLVASGPTCASYRVAAMVLNQAGRDNELVFTATTFECLTAAVASGLGVMALSRSRAACTDLPAWDQGPLPPLPSISCGIYLREGGEREMLEPLADRLAQHFRPRQDGSDRPQISAQSVTPARAIGR